MNRERGIGQEGNKQGSGGNRRDPVCGRAFSGHRGLGQGGVENGFRVGRVVGEQAVPQDVGKNSLDVIGVHGGLAVEQCVGPGGGLQREGAADGHGVILTDERPGGLAERKEVALESVGDGEGGDFLLEDDELLERENTGGVFGVGGSVAVKLENVELGFLRGQGHGNGEEEAIKLGFWKREGARGGSIVLSGDHQEGDGQGLGFAVNGDLVFVHRLKKSGLGARRSAIDFVGEEEVGKDGARDEIEIAVLLPVEIVSDDVGREEVGRELQSFKTAAQGDRKGRSEGGLSDAGGAGHQGVSPGKKGSEQKVGGLLRSEDGGIELCAERLKRVVRHRKGCEGLRRNDEGRKWVIGRCSWA